MSSAKYQTRDQKLGEIFFREKLAIQHTTGEMVLPNYFDKKEHDEILRQRICDTQKRIKELKNKGITISPFVELGAERCHRSLVLVNDFDASGFVVDISYHQLATAQHFAKLFNLKKLPVRVCCDVMHLPFKTCSLPFTFCYEFLHHFPKIRPVIESINRIMSDGYFFFDEEPFKRPRVPLYKQKYEVSSTKYQTRSKVRLFLEKFISKDLCLEEEYGILENHQIPLSEWEKALRIFDSRDVTISSLRKKLQTRMNRGLNIKHIPHLLLGGGIEGLCKKNMPDKKPSNSEIFNLLTCPECLNSNEGKEPTLIHESDCLRCPNCQTVHPIVDDIILLFRRKDLLELYPQFAQLT